MFVRNVLFFTSANLIGQIARVIQELALRVLMPPALLGQWNYISTIQGLGSTFDIGIQSAALRELAMEQGQNNQNEVIKIRVTALFSEWLYRSILIGGVAAYAAWNHSADEFKFWGLLAGALFFGIMGGNECLQVAYQSAQRFQSLGKRLSWYWIFHSTLLIGGAYFGKINGLIFAMFLSLTSLYVVLKSGFGADSLPMDRSYFSFQVFRRLISYGMPVRICEMPMVFFQMIDILFLTKFADFNLLALYSTARLIAVQSSQVISWITSVMIARLTTFYGSVGKTKEEMGSEVSEVLLCYYTLIIPMIVLGATYCFVAGTKFLIPKYQESAKFLPYLLMTVYFYPQTSIIKNFWSIERRFKPILITNLVPCFMAILMLSFSYLKWGVQPKLIAQIMLICFISYQVVLFSWAGRQLWGPGKTIFLLGILALSYVLVSGAIWFTGIYDLLSSNESILQPRIWFLPVLLTLPIMIYGFQKGGLRQKLSRR